MQAFSGIRVLDFTHVLAGPFCTYQLAVMGADVVKIEAPGRADMMRAESASDSLAEEGRGTQFLSQSANKRSLAVDITTPDGVEIIRRLAAKADVLVENFRTGVLSKAGLGFEALAEVNPTLIYCSMTGFGQIGPKAQHPAYDNVIQAFSGLMAATGTATSAPVRVGPPVLDYGTGSQAAFAIASALFQRSKTGEGQYIDVAMLDAALMLMSSTVVDTEVRGAAPPLPGNGSLVNAGYACYETNDGLIMIGAFTGRQRADLWVAIRRHTEALKYGDVDPEQRVGIEQLCKDDARQQLNFEQLSHAEKMQQLPQDRAYLQGVLKLQSAQAWEDLLNSAGVPAARVRSVDEALAHVQVQSRQVLQPAQGLPEEHTDLKVPVAAFSYLHNGPVVQQHAPAHGQHSREVLQELGLDDLRITQLEQSGVVLQAD